MIQVIRSDERYHFENEWLSTYWHFSFDQYYDPANISFGPLRAGDQTRIAGEPMLKLANGAVAADFLLLDLP